MSIKSVFTVDGRNSVVWMLDIVRGWVVRVYRPWVYPLILLGGLEMGIFIHNILSTQFSQS